MLGTVSAKGDKDAGPDVSVLVEGMFAFILRGARRFVQLTGDELGSLKQLSIAFADASESQRPEIMEAMLEIMFPEDQVGGLSKRVNASADATKRAEEWRLKVGDQIREHRSVAKMTQKQLADAAGIPQSHVSRLERGMHAPTHVTIQRIAVALGIEPSEIDPGHPD